MIHVFIQGSKVVLIMFLYHLKYKAVSGPE